MIDPLRFDKESITTYEIERPAYCVSCLSQRQSRNNPNIAVTFCQECPNLLGERKVYGALLCASCNLEKHKAFHARNHIRQMVVVGPGLRKKVVVRGDGVNFPLPLDTVTIKMKARIYHNGRIVHRERPRTMNYIVGMSGKCLHLQVLGARNLGVADVNYTSDPYIIYSFSGKPLSTTRIRPRTLNPRWDNETFIVPLDESLPQPRDMVHSQKDLIKLEVYDYDYLSANDFLGHIEMTRSKLAKLAVVAQEQPIRIPLTSKEYHGIMSVQFGHTSKELYMKIFSAEDLDKTNDKLFNNPYCRILLGSPDNLVGTTATVKRSINPVWNERNEFRISLHDYFQIESLLEAQLQYYRASIGLPQQSAQPKSVTGRGGRRGGAALFQSASAPKAKVMFEEFNDLPEYLSIIRIEIYNKRWLRKDNLLGKTLIHIEQMRLMIPELASLREKYRDDPSSFLSRHHRSVIFSGHTSEKGGAAKRLFSCSSCLSFSRGWRLRGLSRGSGTEKEKEEDHLDDQPIYPYSQRVPAETESVRSRDFQDRDRIQTLPPVQPPPIPPPSSTPYHLLTSTSTSNGSEQLDVGMTSNEPQNSEKEAREETSSRQSDVIPPSPVPNKISSKQSSFHSQNSRANKVPPPILRVRSTRRGNESMDDDRLEVGDNDGDSDERFRSNQEEESEADGSADSSDKEQESDSDEEESESSNRSLSVFKKQLSMKSAASSNSSPALLGKVKSFVSRSIRTVSSVESVMEYTDVFRLTILSNSRKMHLSDVYDDRQEEDLGFLIVRLIISNRGKVISGIDEAVQRMTVGETSLVKCRYDYAYGSYAVDRDVPPRSNVLMRLKLVEINGQGRFSGLLFRTWQRLLRQTVVWRRMWYRYWHSDPSSAAHRSDREQRRQQRENRRKKRRERRRRAKEGAAGGGWWRWLLTCGCLLGRSRSGDYPRRRGRLSQHDDLSGEDYSSYSESQDNSEFDNSLEEGEAEDDMSGFDSNLGDLDDGYDSNDENRRTRRNRYLLEEDAQLDERERLISAKSVAKKSLKPDKFMKKHLTPAVKAGAKLIWNTSKTKLFENQSPTSSLETTSKRRISKKGGTRGGVTSALATVAETEDVDDRDEGEDESDEQEGEERAAAEEEEEFSDDLSED